MRILNVVDRIICRALLGEIEIEIELTVERTHEKEIARRIGADFFDKFLKRDALSGALAHLHKLAASVETDHLKKQHRKFIRVVSQCLHRRLDTADIAMVISAPEIDETVKAALVFVVMISDIRRKVRRLSARTYDDAIFIIAIRRGLQPKCAVLLVDIAICSQNLYRPMDSIRMKRTLAEPVVKVYMKSIEIFF